MKPRVRFAPSPTGQLHLGGARQHCPTIYLLKIKVENFWLGLRTLTSKGQKKSIQIKSVNRLTGLDLNGMKNWCINLQTHLFINRT